MVPTIKNPTVDPDTTTTADKRQALAEEGHPRISRPEPGITDDDMVGEDALGAAQEDAVDDHAELDSDVEGDDDDPEIYLDGTSPAISPSSHDDQPPRQ